MDEFSVKVYIYDLSKGLARSLSMGFLGRQIDGIWHTGIVAYGREFFFGGDGIQSCSPGGTILGHPDNVDDLGTTQIPFDVFMSYLQELSSSSFSGSKYHLLDHNCNTFSDEVAQFLTGHTIPSYVTSLPQEVMQTPFGQMIRPMLDSMSVNPGNNESVLFPSSPASTPQSQQSPSKSANAQPAPLQPFKYDDTKVTMGLTNMAASFKEKLSADEYRTLQEVGEYVTITNPTWSLSPAHIKLMGSLASRPDMSDKESGVVCGLMRLCVLKADVISLLKHTKDMSIMSLMHNYDQLQRQAQLSLVRTTCNLSSCKEGHEWLLATEEWPVDDDKTNNSKTTVKVCVSSLLHDDADVIKSGVSLAFNLVHFKVSEEVAVEVGSALIQSLIKGPNPPAARLSLQTLYACMEASAEVTGLAVVMGLDVASLSSNNPELSDICSEIKKKLGTFSI